MFLPPGAAPQHWDCQRDALLGMRMGPKALAGLLAECLQSWTAGAVLGMWACHVLSPGGLEGEKEQKGKREERKKDEGGREGRREREETDRQKAI